MQKSWLLFLLAVWLAITEYCDLKMVIFKLLDCFLFFFLVVDSFLHLPNHFFYLLGMMLQVQIRARGCWQKEDTKETTSGNLMAAWFTLYLACNLNFFWKLLFSIQSSNLFFKFFHTEMQIIASGKPVSKQERTAIGHLLVILESDSCILKSWS